MKIKKKKFLLLQVRRHVGEINWILPIIYLLKKEGYSVITYFDDHKTFDLFKKNIELYKVWREINYLFFIQKKSDKLINKILFRIILILSKILNKRFDDLFFFQFLRRNLYSSEKIYNIIQGGSLKCFFVADNSYSNLYLYFKNKNPDLKIVRFPHSQFPPLKQKYDVENKKLHYGDFYLYRSIEDFTQKYGKDKLTHSMKNKIIECGNLMYERWWLNKVFKKKVKKNKKFKIVVATRPWESNFWSKETFKSIILSIMKITSIFKDTQIIFKIHPSEKEKDYLIKLLNSYKSNFWKIDYRHLISISKSCDLGITLNTSACLDIVSMRKPCIEFWLKNKVLNQNLIYKVDGKIKTPFEIFGIVLNVNNYDQLLQKCKSLKNKKIRDKIVNEQYLNFLKLNNNKKLAKKNLKDIEKLI